MTWGLVMAPSSTATSGNTSWMLKTKGTRQRRAAAQPAAPSVRGGDMASTASGRPGCPAQRRQRAGQRREPGEGQRPGRDVGLVGGERVDPGDAAPLDVLAAHRLALPPRLDAGVLVPGQRGDDVEPVAPGASSVAMLVMTSPVGARSGAKCGQRTRRFTGPYRRVRLGTPGSSARPSSSTRTARRATGRPRRAGRARRRRSAASAWPSAQASGSSGLRRMPASPTTSGSAVVSAAMTGVPRLMASSTGRPKPS